MTEIHLIKFKLYTTLEGVDRIDAYSDLVTYINKIADHLLKKHRKTGMEVNKVMGGHILELEQERLKRIGREEGFEKGREEQRIEDEKIIAEMGARLEEKDAHLEEKDTRIKELEAQVAALKKA